MYSTCSICTCMCDHVSFSIDGKILRHSEIKVDLVTWSRLLTRATPVITDGDSSSPYGSKQTQIIGSNLKPTALGFDSDSSPPQSESQSGENSPKTPDTPGSPGGRPSSPLFLKQGAESHRASLIQNGELPPVEPMSDAELMQIPDQIILPPPAQFQLVKPPQYQLVTSPSYHLSLVYYTLSFCSLIVARKRPQTKPHPPTHPHLNTLMKGHGLVQMRHGIRPTGLKLLVTNKGLLHHSQNWSVVYHRSGNICVQIFSCN